MDVDQFAHMLLETRLLNFLENLIIEMDDGSTV